MDSLAVVDILPYDSVVFFIFTCRYVLDGDRDELRNIRHELANLRSASHGQADIQQQRQSEQRQLNELKEKQQTHYKQQRSTQLDQSHDGRLSATPYSSTLSPSSSSSSSSSSAPSKPPPSFFHIRVQPTQLLRRDDRDGSIQSDDLEVLSINNDDDSNTDNSQNSSYNSDNRNRNNDDGYRNHSKSNSNYPQVNSNSSTSISNLIEDEDDEDMPRISLSPPTPMPFLLPSTTFQPQSLPLPLPLPLPHTVLGSVRKSSPVSPSQSYPPQSLAQHRVMDTSSSSSYSGNYSPPKSDEFRRREEEKKGATEFKSGTDPRETLRGLRMQIQELLETGMYSDRDDPVIVALNAEITLVEAMVVSLHR